MSTLSEAPAKGTKPCKLTPTKGPRTNCSFNDHVFTHSVLTGLLSADLLAVAAPLVPALLGADGESRVALAADAPVDVRLLSEELEGRLVRIFGATTEAEHEVEGGVLLDGVVLERVAVLELLAGEDQTLLIGRDALLVLDLSLDVLDPVSRLDLERDVLPREGLDEDLHVA